MTAKPESRLRTKIVKKLRSIGGKWEVVHGGPYQAAGISDIIGCYEGIFWALEVKTPKKWKTPGHNLSVLQVKFLEAINKNHGRAYCICSVDQAAYLISDSTIAGPSLKKLEELS